MDGVEPSRQVLTLSGPPDVAAAVPFVVGMGDIARDRLRSHMQREGDLFYYMAFANAGNEQLQPLLQDYPLVERKQYRRHGYTLDLYSFRFKFTP